MLQNGRKEFYFKLDTKYDIVSVIGTFMVQKSWKSNQSLIRSATGYGLLVSTHISDEGARLSGTKCCQNHRECPILVREYPPNWIFSWRTLQGIGVWFVQNLLIVKHWKKVPFKK